MIPEDVELLCQQVRHRVAGRLWRLRLERAIEQPKPPRRKRKPTLASVSRQARTAGIEVAAYEVRPDGTIKVITGKPTVVSDGDDTTPIDRSEWN
jgi:hypothetical protein